MSLKTPESHADSGLGTNLPQQAEMLLLLLQLANNHGEYFPVNKEFLSSCSGFILQGKYGLVPLTQEAAAQGCQSMLRSCPVIKPDLNTHTCII